MKITVFGANGGVGLHLLSQALDRGHDVTAVVRKSARLADPDPALRLLAVPGLEDPEVVRTAIDGCDAVLSAIGPRGKKAGPVTSTCTRAILTAMQRSGVPRLIAISAAPVGQAPPKESVLNRYLLLPVVGAILRDVYRDLAEMEADLQRSGLDWTALRPPKLTDRSLTRNYRIAVGANVARGYSISRADVADAALDALENGTAIRQVLGIAS